METTPKSDLAAYSEPLLLPSSELVGRVADVLGRKLTAYIGGAKDVRAVDRWITGGSLYGDARERFQLAFQIMQMLRSYDSDKVIQGWMTGMNPELDDRVPLRLVREGDLKKVSPEILRAARKFVAEG